MSAIVHEAVTVKHQTYTTFRVRVIVAGDAAVGKTALVKLLSSHGADYPRNYVMTSVPEVASRVLRVPQGDLSEGSPPCQVDLMLFDIPGSSTFSMRETAGLRHWDSAGALVIVFDLGSRESFTSAAKWLRRAQEARASGSQAGSTSSGSGSSSGSSRPKLIGVVVGNKADFREAGVERAEVSAAEAKAFADSVKMPYFEVSAERNVDVESPFAYIATEWAKAMLDEA